LFRPVFLSAPFHKYSQATAAASAPAAFRSLPVLTEYDSVTRPFKERRIDALGTLPYLWKGALSFTQKSIPQGQGDALLFQFRDIRQVAELLVVVESIAYDKHIGNREALVLYRQINFALDALLVEKRANLK